jgi:hypothetical protein
MIMQHRFNSESMEQLSVSTPLAYIPFTEDESILYDLNYEVASKPESLQATPPDYILRIDCSTKKDYPKWASDQGLVPRTLVLPMLRPGHPIGEVQKSPWFSP